MGRPEGFESPTYWKLGLRPGPARLYGVDPLVCPRCCGTMKVISFLTDYFVVDRIINHLKLTFVADRPSPQRLVYQEVLMAAEASSEYFP